MSGSAPIRVPMPTMHMVNTTALPSAAPASCTAPARPTTAVSTSPIERLSRLGQRQRERERQQDAQLVAPSAQGMGEGRTWRGTGLS